MSENSNVSLQLTQTEIDMLHPVTSDDDETTSADDESVEVIELDVTEFTDDLTQTEETQLLSNQRKIEPLKPPHGDFLISAKRPQTSEFLTEVCGISRFPKFYQQSTHVSCGIPGEQGKHSAKIAFTRIWSRLINQCRRVKPSPDRLHATEIREGDVLR